MKKIFLGLLVSVLAVGVGGYFALQWKVNKSVDDFFAALFFVDANYSDVKVGVDGKLTISNIDIFIKQAQKTVSIDAMSISTGSLMESIQLEKRIQDGKLPTALKFDLSNFSMSLDRDFMRGMESAYSADTLSELLALGCGRHTSIGPTAFFDMGNRDLTFDLSMGYEFEKASDTLTSTFDFFLSGVGHVVVDQSYIGVGPIMENFQSVMFGFDPASVTPIDLTISYVDLGYNANMQKYCATASGMERDKWLTLNRAMFAAALDQFDFNSEVDILQLYSDVMAERSRMSVSMRPLPSFSVTDLQFYDIATLIDMLDLKLVVNNESVEIGDISLDQEKYAKLNLSDLRREYRVGPKEEVVETTQEAQSKELERILKEIPLRDLERHLNREVFIERFDGKTFTGELTAVAGNRVVVRTRFRSGYTDLPLNRAEIKTAKLYPEN